MQPSNVGLTSARVPTCAFHFRKCLGAKTTHWGLTRGADGTFQQESANCVKTDFVCLFDLKLDYLIRPCALHLRCDFSSTRIADTDLKKSLNCVFSEREKRHWRAESYNVIMTELANLYDSFIIAPFWDSEGLCHSTAVLFPPLISAVGLWNLMEHSKTITHTCNVARYLIQMDLFCYSCDLHNKFVLIISKNTYMFMNLF